MSEHTPGEWRLGPLDHNEQRTIIGPDGQLIAVCAHECVTSKAPVMEANAERIVRMNRSYDDLIAACEAAIESFEILTGDDSPFAGNEIALGSISGAFFDIGKTRDAVAKAKGETQ